MGIGGRSEVLEEGEDSLGGGMVLDRKSNI